LKNPSVIKTLSRGIQGPAVRKMSLSTAEAGEIIVKYAMQQMEKI